MFSEQLRERPARARRGGHPAPLSSRSETRGPGWLWGCARGLPRRLHGGDASSECSGRSSVHSSSYFLFLLKHLLFSRLEVTILYQKGSYKLGNEIVKKERERDLEITALGVALGSHSATVRARVGGEGACFLFRRRM